MSNRQIFSQVVGSPLPKNLSPMMTTIMRLYQERLQFDLEQIKTNNPAMIEGIYVDTVDEMQFNAVAYADDSFEFVGINAGVAVILPLIANWLLCQPEAFKKIGDSSQEIKPAQFDGNIIRYSGKASTMPDSLWPKHIGLPKDPARKHFVTYLITVAWDFLLFHELAHITRCHLPYMSGLSETPSCSWLEMGNSGMTKEEYQIRCALEIDADGVAGRILAGAPRLNGLDKAREIAFGKGNKGVSKWNWEESFKTWLYPIGFLFQIMAIIDYSDEITAPHRTHPHPDIRMQVLLNSIYPQWEKVIPDRKKFISLSREASQEIQNIVEVGILPNSPSRNKPSYNDSFQEKVLELWEDLQSRAENLNNLTKSRLQNKRARKQ